MSLIERTNVTLPREVVEEVREALFNATAMIGHNMPPKATALVAGEKLVSLDVWHAGSTALAKLKDALDAKEQDQ